MAEVYVTTSEVAAAWPDFALLDPDEQQALVDAASAAVSSYCRREFAWGMRTETHSGANAARIYLRVRPVESVSAVVVNGSSLDNTGGDAWSFNPLTGELIRNDGRCDPRFDPWFPTGFGNVVVTYVGGYDPIPAAIKRATIQTVLTFARATRIMAGPYRSESLGDYSYTLADSASLGAAPGLPDMALALLSPYVQDAFW